MISKIVLFFVVIFGVGFSQAGTDLLSIKPRSDFKEFGLFKSNSKCQGNLKPSLDRLNSLKRQGHQIAFISTGGTSIAAPRLAVKDVFQGRRYLDINTLLTDMEDYVRSTGLRDRELIQEEVKNCVRGQHKSNRILKESCTQNFGTIFAHMGIAVLNSKVHSSPYIVHFYTNPDTGWFRPAIRVETAESYLKEKGNISCATKIILPKTSAQRKIKEALHTNLPYRMLAPGKQAYNLISHPWGLKTQNCNEWLAGFLAGSLFSNRSHWNTLSRENARDTLIQTGFTPSKVVLGGGQSLAGIIAQLPGFGAYEGNINHFYGVGDGLPSRTVVDWLNRNGQLQNQWLIRGSFSQ